MTAEGARNKADDICRRLQEARVRPPNGACSADLGRAQALDHLTEAQDAATAEKLSQEVKRQLASLLEVLKDVEKSYAAGREHGKGAVVGPRLAPNPWKSLEISRNMLSLRMVSLKELKFPAVSEVRCR